MQRFEYKVLDVVARGWWNSGGRIDYQELADRLNEYGREGWEVVSSSSVNKWQGVSRALIIILKRPINDNR